MKFLDINRSSLSRSVLYNWNKPRNQNEYAHCHKEQPMLKRLFFVSPQYVQIVIHQVVNNLMVSTI